MRRAKVSEKAKRYAPLIARLYCSSCLLNGERHDEHVLAVAQLDRHLEMELAGTKDLLAGRLSCPDYHDSVSGEAERLQDHCVRRMPSPAFRVRGG